jgi:hypothetical protein
MQQREREHRLENFKLSQNLILHFLCRNNCIYKRYLLSYAVKAGYLIKCAYELVVTAIVLKRCCQENFHWSVYVNVCRVHFMAY